MDNKSRTAEHIRGLIWGVHSHKVHPFNQSESEIYNIFFILSLIPDAKDQSFDVVIAVDCFHWFSFQESLNEIHRVLIPGGMLGLSWNLLSPDIPWQKTIRDFLVPFYEKNSIIPRKDLAEMVASSKLFLKEGEDSTSFFEEKKCHPEEAYQYMISISVLNAWCSDEEKEEFKALFDKITKEILVETGKQEFTIIFTIPIFWFKKSPKA